MKIILFLIYFLIITSMKADVISSQELEKLSTNQTWLRLLHYKNGKSTIKNKSFFLDKHGNTSPKEELKKTLEEYYEPFNKNKKDKHAQCRYPARYFWLSHNISLRNYQPINPNCSKLKKWKLLQNTQSISIIFVSGYLGNPASAFGHSFIKINQSKNNNKNLFDTTISYGALLPTEYTMPEYIVNGITGGYDASYSDKYYYNQDITYSNEEFRDMWEYQLNLNNREKKLFLFHTWEIMGKKFQYFFLNRNCGYKVGEFLELVLNKNIIDNAYIWYAPVETFFKLQELNQEYNGTLIQKVIYHPSKEQKIYAHYNSLKDNEKEIVKKMIEQNLTSIPSSFKELQKITKANALDFILSYQKYKFPQISNRKLLLNRLKFPIREKKIIKPKNREDIAHSNKNSFLGISRNNNHYTEIHWSPFAIESVGYNDLNGDELVVLETQLQIKNKKLYLKKFDLIRIQKLTTKKLLFENRNSLSWKLRIGTENQEGIQNKLIQGGIGKAWELTPYIKPYIFLNGLANTEKNHFQIQPTIGFFSNLNRLRLSSDFGYKKNIVEGIDHKVIQVKGEYKFLDNLSLFGEYQLNKSENFNIGIKYFY